ncbi:MAG: cation-translocating P-type ATPase [Candidatus Sericytochromatia bacterium]
MSTVRPPTDAPRLSDRPWHAIDAETAMQALDTPASGLSDAEAVRRLGEFGENALTGQEGPSAWAIFWRQFKSPLIYILLAAAAISFFVGKRFDPYVILGIVLVNALIGFFQERQAARALQALQALTEPQVTVMRDGQPHRLEAKKLVPGDVLLLHPGDRIGADARVLASSELTLEEAALTGESMPVSKHHRRIAGDAAMPLGDQRNMAFMGTTVVSGTGRALVVATGMATQMGRIAHEVSGEATATPLQRRLEDFSRKYGLVVLGLIVVVAAIAVAKGFGLAEVFLTALSMAVSGIPEGLPIVISVLLAIGVNRMAGRKALVRRLPAVEALGGATVIGSDKTGTLTRNEMTVTRLFAGGRRYRVTGEGYAPEGAVEPALSEDAPLRDWLGAIARHCNDASLQKDNGRWTVVGGPTEGALQTLAYKLGHDAPWERLEEIPFSSERKWMATLHARPEGDRVILVKGAFDRLLAMAKAVMGPDGRPEPMTEAHRRSWAEAAEAMAEDALRVLALAMVPANDGQNTLCLEAIEDRLVLVGLAGLIDPPRPEAIQAIARCHEAGIRVVMITGDHVTTATAIARQMGILRGDAVARSIDGPSLEAMDEGALSRRIRELDVFARVNPIHKLRIVKALQATGAIVAMTGDGVNDAPALKAADIGVAMGITGTEVAKGAADMVLADDNFATIEAAVEEGRVIADNLKKVLQYLLTTSAGEILAITAAIIAGYPLPLAAVQILWVNLVTDGVMDKTLALEKGEPGVMRRPPRDPRSPLFTRAMVARLAFGAAIMATGTVAVFAWDLGRGSPIEHARTMAFTTLVAYQWFSAFSFRSLDQSLFTIGPFSNRWMLLGLLIGVSLQLLAVYWAPFQLIFQTQALSAADFARCVLVASTAMIGLELAKGARALWRR